MVSNLCSKIYSRNDSSMISCMEENEINLFDIVSPSTIPHPGGIQPGNLVLFETTDSGLQALALSNIQSIRGATLKTTYQRKTLKNCLSINYKNETGSNQTGLMKYLTFGITWAPSYK